MESCILIQDLDLSFNRIRDITPLKSHKRLIILILEYILVLEYNRIQHIQPLKDLNLKFISLNDNKISDSNELDVLLTMPLITAMVQFNPLPPKVIEFFNT